MEQDQIIEEFRILDAGSSFITKKAKELGEKYPKRFIAVREDQLIAVDDSFDGIMKKIREKNMDPSSVLVEYIPGKDEIIFY